MDTSVQVGHIKNPTAVENQKSRLEGHCPDAPVMSHWWLGGGGGVEEVIYDLYMGAIV